MLGGTIALAFLGVLIRALPLLLDPSVGLSSVWFFASGLLPSSLQTCVVLSCPTATTLALATAADRGETQACTLSGASPFQLATRSSPLWAALSGLILCVALLFDRSTTTLVNGWVITAKQACDSTTRPLTKVPFLDAVWWCPSPTAEQSHVEPTFALASRGALFRASAIEFDESAHSAEAHSVMVDLKGPPTISLKVDHATIHGLAPLGRGKRFSAPINAGVVCLFTLLSAAGAQYSMIRWPNNSRPRATAIGVAISAMLLAIISQFGLLQASPSIVLLGHEHGDCGIAPFFFLS